MTQPRLTDQLLLRLQCQTQQAAQLPAAIARWSRAAPWTLQPLRLAYSHESRWAYAYLRLAEPMALGPDELASAKAGLPAGTEVSRLQLVFEASGHSSAQAPLHHYVVETDPAPGWFEEI
ncbi:MAG: hypothetical protein WCK08_09785, partial [Betaproteobacteria bacterium]